MHRILAVKDCSQPQTVFSGIDIKTCVTMIRQTTLAENWSFRYLQMDPLIDYLQLDRAFDQLYQCVWGGRNTGDKLMRVVTKPANLSLPP
ncbi:MAG: hypothetical protein GY774_26680 [Planctomycetes bacterium]|nr:hypothetical protein [Planctomycetota bacterium]